ncbi:uncharacterized protein LOC127833598 [Dreissena polymorpha]|uniref:uncharacterized protein LOC127833598 n=1 Tax=Dreissena polymorpha TaxID=45954 RepID=UPI002263D35C|nr:uncharacterized protein LOC127833598 [Dreissena polymorpha]
MAMLVFVLSTLLLPATVLSASYDPLFIDQPSIAIKAEQNGAIGLNSGLNGNVTLAAGYGGSIYLDGEDILFIIQMIESKPPVWQSHGPVSSKTPYGYLGEFKAGEVVNMNVSAVDPEGLNVTYSVVAGSLPPGISLRAFTGTVSGIIPDADATYVFTIRATDGHGKYADNIFRIVTRGYDGCATVPCLNEGACTDHYDGFSCDCVRPYGGVTCNLNCASNPLGISNSLKYVKDAQLSGFNMYSSYAATAVRIDGGSAWYGMDATSYFQVDFGNETDVFAVGVQYADANYYTQYFYVQYSVDGNHFYNYTDYTGTTQRLSGNTGGGTHMETLPSVITARYVRVYPLTWNTSYKPAFRLEMYGCYSYKK